MAKKLEWMKMNDFFPSEEFKTEFEISDKEGGSWFRCPICGEKIHQVFIRASDTPIFSGWGPCCCRAE